MNDQDMHGNGTDLRTTQSSSEERVQVDAPSDQQFVPLTPPPASPDAAGTATAGGSSEALTGRVVAPRRSRRTIALVVTGLLVVLLATASVSTILVLNHRADVAAQERQQAAERKAEQQRAAAAEARREAAAKKAAELAAAHRTYNSCTEQLNPLVNVLSNVDARLDVGLDQGDLSDMVGRASIAYSRINVHALGTGACLAAGAQLETAFNDYNGTVRRWNDCIFDYSCDVDTDVLPTMQLKWASASRAIKRAQRLIGTLDPDSPSYRKDGSASNT